MYSQTPENRRLVQLLKRVALKDHAAFEELYQLSCAHLYGVAWRLVLRREIADEIVQDAFINVWEGAASYCATRAAPMTWLISIVRHKALDRLRNGKLENANSCSLDDGTFEQVDMPDEDADPQKLWAAAMERGRLNRCLSQLAAHQRQALALAYFEGLSHGELASHLRVPLGTAKAWVRRGIVQLKKGFDAASQPS